MHVHTASPFSYQYNMNFKQAVVWCHVQSVAVREVANGMHFVGLYIFLPISLLHFVMGHCKLSYLFNVTTSRSSDVNSRQS